MKVMLFPQPSMRSYKTGKWQLEMDPQLNKNRAWVNASRDWDWCWLLPPTADWSQESGKGIPDDTPVKCVPWAPNVQTARFNFPWDEIVGAIAEFEPDAMICEVPEHVLALKMAREWLDLSFPIFAYINYSTIFDYTSKVGGVDTWRRQVEGCIEADRVVFNTEGFMGRWMEKAVSEDFADIPETKVLLWEAVYSPTEVVKAGEHTTKAEPPAIFFTSRLTDPRKNRHPQFFDALRQLEKQGMEFQTWIGDPNRSLTDEIIRKMAPNVTKIRCNSREEYLGMVNEAAIIPTLWAQDMIYSIGYCDAIAGGALSIVAAEDPKKVGGITVPSEADTGDIYNALHTAISLFREPGLGNLTTALDLQSSWLMEKRSVEKNMWRICNDVEALA